MLEDDMAETSRRSPWLTAEGILLVLLGIAAVVMPLMAGLAATLVFAWILILTGAIGLISAFAGRAHAHLGWSLASAVLALVVGAVLFLYPLAGAVALTIVIAAYLFLDGIALVGLGLDHRRRAMPNWMWLLGSGAIDIVLALVIMFMSAIGSAVFLGVVVGLSLVSAGVALLMLHRLPPPAR
jgi:uncharacterized membrane protein HdeD (DUF308 family)